MSVALRLATNKEKISRRGTATILLSKQEGVGTSNFTTTTGHFFHYIKSPFLVDHYYDITTLKVPFKLITTTTLSMF
jgi:hypothetical protein